jgi:plasmid stability protein
MVNMAAITVRNLPEETHRALKMRAARNGRSTEAEVRAILEETLLPKQRIKIGSALAALADKYELDLNLPRESETPRAFDFE